LKEKLNTKGLEKIRTMKHPYIDGGRAENVVTNTDTGKYTI
jgi:hypothetical protein